MTPAAAVSDLGNKSLFASKQRFGAGATRQTRSGVRCGRNSRGAFTTALVSPFPHLIPRRHSTCRKLDVSASRRQKAATHRSVTADCELWLFVGAGQGQLGPVIVS